MSKFERFVARVLAFLFMPIFYLYNAMTGPGIRYGIGETILPNILVFACGMIGAVIYSEVLRRFAGSYALTGYWILALVLVVVDDKVGLFRNGRRLRILMRNREGRILQHWRGLTITAVILTAIGLLAYFIGPMISEVLLLTIAFVIMNIYNGGVWIYKSMSGWTAGEWEVFTLVLLSGSCVLFLEIAFLNAKATIRNMAETISNLRGNNTNLSVHISFLVAGYEALRVDILENQKQGRVGQKIRELIEELQRKVIGKPTLISDIERWQGIIRSIRDSHRQRPAS